MTQISGTPSHLRRVRISGGADAIDSRDVRLSGEVEDQSLLDALRVTYSMAQLAHAFTSIEAGVAFDVNKGLATFPDTFVNQRGRLGADIRLKEADGASCCAFTGWRWPSTRSRPLCASNPRSK